MKFVALPPNPEQISAIYTQKKGDRVKTSPSIDIGAIRLKTQHRSQIGADF